MKRSNYFFFTILFSSILYCQDSSQRNKQTEREILMTEDTDMEVLAKGRKLLLLCINQDSIQKAVEVMDFLDTKYQFSRIMPFWRDERIIIAFWLQQYDYVLNMENLEPSLDEGYRQKIVPPRDLLGRELQEKSKLEKTKLITEIITSHRTDEEKQFLKLLLATWIVDKANPKRAQDSLNMDADLFISEFPQSNFVPYIRKYVRFVYVSSTWGYGYDISFGYAGLFGKVSDVFSNSAVIGIGFDVSYKQFVLYPRIAFGFGSSVKQAFSHPPGITWQKNLALNIFVPELTAGYAFVENDFIRLTPFAGITGVLIAPPEREKEIPGNDVELNSNASLIYGINVDLRLGSQSSSMFNFSETGRWNIKLRLSMSNLSYTGTNAGFSGSCFYITVGFGGFNRPIHRDE